MYTTNNKESNLKGILKKSQKPDYLLKSDRLTGDFLMRTIRDSGIIPLMSWKRVTPYLEFYTTTTNNNKIIQE